MEKLQLVIFFPSVFACMECERFYSYGRWFFIQSSHRPTALCGQHTLQNSVLSEVLQIVDACHLDRAELLHGLGRISQVSQSIPVAHCECARHFSKTFKENFNEICCFHGRTKLLHEHHHQKPFFILWLQNKVIACYICCIWYTGCFLRLMMLLECCSKTSLLMMSVELDIDVYLEEKNKITK